MTGLIWMVVGALIFGSGVCFGIAIGYLISKAEDRVEDGV